MSVSAQGFLNTLRGFLFLSFTLPAQNTRDQGRKSRKTGRFIADKMKSLKDEARRTLLRTWLLLNLASLSLLTSYRNWVRFAATRSW